MKKSAIIVVGTRPDAIKMAPIYFELKEKPDILVKIISTGQHRELLTDVFQEFSIVPDYELNVMKYRQSLCELTASILSKLGPILKEENPDLLMVHGDTTTSFSAALAGFYLQIPIYHVEAGLRSFRLDSPFPEEFNRKAITRMSSKHFAVDRQARCNLLDEGVSKQNIEITGNTVFESLTRMIGEKSRESSKIQILLTLHRREKGDHHFKEILQVIKQFCLDYSEVNLVYPLHANPKIKQIAHETFDGVERVQLLPPQKYSKFLHIMQDSKVIVTDSGGVQEEASFLNKKVLILRSVSERNDGFENGQAVLVGSTAPDIRRALEEAIVSRERSEFDRPIGKGASKKICDTLTRHLKAL